MCSCLHCKIHAQSNLKDISLLIHNGGEKNVRHKVNGTPSSTTHSLCSKEADNLRRSYKCEKANHMIHDYSNHGGKRFSDQQLQNHSRSEWEQVCDCVSKRGKWLRYTFETTYGSHICGQSNLCCRCTFETWHRKDRFESTPQGKQTQHSQDPSSRVRTCRHLNIHPVRSHHGCCSH